MATGVAVAVVSSLVTIVPGMNTRYYARHFSENEPLYTTLVDILHAFREDNHTHSICKTFDGVEIAADMMCFRNPAGNWDYSDRARMKVRLQYNQMTHRLASPRR